MKIKRKSRGDIKGSPWRDLRNKRFKNKSRFIPTIPKGILAENKEENQN